MNAPVEAPKGVSECGVETSEVSTAGRRGIAAMATLAPGSDE